MRVLMGEPLRFATTRILRASNADVWRVLGDFGNEHAWARDLERCERDTPDVRVGTTRTCELAKPLMGVKRAVETLTEYEPGHALAYRLHGSAGPFADAQSRWSTAPAHGGTAVTIEGRFTPKSWASRYVVWPLARRFIVRVSQRTLRELEAHLTA